MGFAMTSLLPCKMTPLKMSIFDNPAFCRTSEPVPGPQSDAIAVHKATALHRPLPDVAAKDARLHLPDTLAAIASGAALPAGRAKAARRANRGGGADYWRARRALGGAPQAALANAAAAQADETDDSHVGSRFPPGCASVPAAVAKAAAGPTCCAPWPSAVTSKTGR